MVEWRARYRVAEQLPSLFYVPDYIGPAEEDALLREVRASRAKWVQLSGRRLQNHGGVVHAKGLIPAPLPGWLQPLLRRLAEEGGDGGQYGGLYGGQPPNHVLVNSYQPGEGIMPHEDGPAYHPVVAILSLGAPAVLRFRRKARDAGVPAGEGGDGGGSGSRSPTCASGAPHLPTPTPDADADAAADATPAPAASAPVASVLLQPRSLVVFRDEAFTDCLHSIDEVAEEALDGSVANLAMYGLRAGGSLPRGGERVSLTVRRVARVLPAVLRPRGH